MSENGENVKCSSGFLFKVDSPISQIDNDDFVILCAGQNIKKNTTKKLLNWIRKESRKKFI